MFRNGWYIVAGMTLTIVVGFLLFVWPTVYRHDWINTEDLSGPVRTHRLTGQTEFLTLGGWKRQEGVANVELPPEQLARIEGTGHFYGNELSLNIYNGTEFRINEIVVNVMVTRAPDAAQTESPFARYARERGLRTTQQGVDKFSAPPPGFEIVELDRDYRLKKDYFTDPLETGIFCQYLGFTPDHNQKWSWYIKSARGMPQ